MRNFGDPYPYFRGMLAEIGLPFKKIYYDQPRRKFGITKNNWYTLYDIGMLGIINHSRVPLRLATFAGFGGAAISFFIACIYLLLKLTFWNTFSFGTAPMLIGVFLHRFGSTALPRRHGRVHRRHLHAGTKSVRTRLNSIASTSIIFQQLPAS